MKLSYLPALSSSAPSSAQLPQVFRHHPHGSSEHVNLKSIVPTKRPEHPWRLDSAWRGGDGLGGFPRSVARQWSIWSGRVDNETVDFQSTSASGSTVLGPRRFPELRLNSVAIPTAC